MCLCILLFPVRQNRLCFYSSFTQRTSCIYRVVSGIFGIKYQSVLSVCLSLSIYLSVCLSVYLTLSFWLPVDLSYYIFFCLSDRLCVRLSVLWCVTMLRWFLSSWSFRSRRCESESLHLRLHDTIPAISSCLSAALDTILNAFTLFSMGSSLSSDETGCPLWIVNFFFFV